MNSHAVTERAWAEWLDAVEAAARTLEQDPLAMPALPMPLPMPSSPWPASLEGRRREVLATLAAATQTLERRRDETGAALSRLARTPARSARPGYTDGAALDVLG